MEFIGQGAEAKLFTDGKAVRKERIEKSYRLFQIDLALRRSRTRREAKVLAKLPPSVHHPKLISMDDRSCIIEMDFIDGNKVRDILEKDISLCNEIGKKVGLMHNEGIIHGDLTTSNMIFSGGAVYFIDFGLSFFSKKHEDKAVDLHLLRRALESKHHTVYEDAFRLVVEGYNKTSQDSKEVLERLKVVESRGRNKKKKKENVVSTASLEA